MKKLMIFFITFLFLIAAVSIGFSIKEKGNSKYILNDNLVKQVSSKMSNYTSVDKIPKNLKNAVISVEDKRFYDHHGFDFLGMGRALYVNLKLGKVKQGGSTITQQLAKNLFLSNERSVKRKFKELYYTFELEKRYTKDQILEMYLNVIYYGSNTYGIGNASKKYFHKDVNDLSLSECAMLAGIPQSPNKYNPIKHPKQARKRQAAVLEAMTRNGFIKKSVKEAIRKQVLLTVR